MQKYKLSRDPVFAFSLLGEGSHPCNPVSHTTIVDLCCILSLYKNRITGFQGEQSYKMVFVALASNIQCVLHQSCPMKTQHFTDTNEKSSYLTNNAVPSGRQTVGLVCCTSCARSNVGCCNNYRTLIV